MSTATRQGEARARLKVLKKGAQRTRKPLKGITQSTVMEQSATVQKLSDLSELERFARLAQYLVPMTQSEIERRLSGLKEHPHPMRAMSLSQPTP
jgi:hypothetical protein